MQTAPVSKPIAPPKAKKATTRKKVSKQAAVSERKVRQAQKVKKESPEQAVGEFTNFLQSVRNESKLENDLSSEKPPLAENAGVREFDLWLACHTQAEIAEREGISVQPVKDVISDLSANLPKNLKAAADHLTDFDPPIYNIWKFKEKSRGSNHFGNSDPTIP